MNTTLPTLDPSTARRVLRRDLFDDFADREVAPEAGLTGGTEPASHRAPTDC